MASAAKELRYSNTGMVYGDLAYDLDRELRERQFRHAGEAPRQRQAAKELPQVRRATGCRPGSGKSSPSSRCWALELPQRWLCWF